MRKDDIIWIATFIHHRFFKRWGCQQSASPSLGILRMLRWRWWYWCLDLALILKILDNINENKTIMNIGIIGNMAKMLSLLKIINKTPWCKTSISSPRCTTDGRSSNPYKSFFAKTRTGSKLRKKWEIWESRRISYNKFTFQSWAE